MTLSKFFSSIVRPFAVFGLSFLLIGWGSLNVIRYKSFVSALQQSEKMSGQVLGDVLAESDNLEDLLITFNYETIFAQPVEFQKDIRAPNVIYTLTAGDGIELSGDTQKPTVKNTGVLSVNGVGGDVTIEAGENITLVEEDGKLTVKSTDTDTHLSESEVEAYVFDGGNTGVFNNVKIGSIFISDNGTSALTSGSSLVGVFTGNFNTVTGDNLQQVIQSIDDTLSAVDSVSHVAVTLAGGLDYLTLTGQQITLNQIDLTTDVIGNLPVANGGTGSNTVDGARNNMGLGTSDTVGFGSLGVGTTDPSYPLSIEVDNPSSVTMSMRNTSNTGWTSIRYYDDAGVRSASFGYGNTGAAKFKDIAYIQTYQPTTSIAFATNSTDRIFITPTGDVGIGTTTPSAKLQVAGDIVGSTVSDGTIAITGGNITGASNITGSGTATFGSFSGSGASLTNLNASNLASGTVPSARISGSYTGITGVGTISTGTWQGSVISSTYLDTNVILSSEIDTSSELESLISGETGSGALVFGTAPVLASPSFTGNIYFPGSGIWNSSGSVGIGTTSPGATLDVQGAAQFGSGNVDLINSTGKIAAINTTYFASVDGSALTNLNASNLASGTVSSPRVSGSYTGITGTGALNAGSISSGFGNINIGTSIFTGNGSGLTTLNASNLSSGTVADARISGAYTGLTNITGSGTATFATFSGSGASLTSLNASNLSSGTVASARISGSYTGITGTGALNAGSISSGFGNINIGTSTFTGNGSGLTTLNASNLGSGTVPDARITGAYTGLTNLTGSGSSTFGSYLLSSNGTASAPAIRWSSDTNMGIYRVSSDQLGFSTNGTVRMYLNSWGGLAIGDLDNFLLGPSVGNRLYVGGASSSDSANERLANIEYINTRSDTGSFPQRSLEVTYSNEGSDAPGSRGYAVYGSASNLQTNTTGGAVHESYGVYGEAIGNLNGSSYARGIWCSSTGADNNQCGGNQAWTNTSDARVKTNVTRIDGALDILNSLRGVRFQRTDDGSDKVHVGFLAQEVLPYVPEVVYYDEAADLYSMGYAELTAVIVNAVQEQNQIVLTNKSNIQKANISLNETGEVLAIVKTQTQKLLSDQNNILNQINLEKSIQDTKMASQSATLDSVKDRLEVMEKMTNDTEAVIAGLQDRISQLESLFVTQAATDEAGLGEGTGDVLGIADRLDLETLTVTDDTNLNNLGVTGDITAGLLSIKGFDDALATPSAIISTISGPLKIQDQAAGNLEIMGGKVLINTDGNIVVRGSITVNKINIDETEESNKSIGEGIITSGNNEVVINTTSVTNNSKIFVTGKNVVSTPIVVTEKVPGESFTVRVADTAESDISFDWLIVN